MDAPAPGEIQAPLETAADPAEIAGLVKLAERSCVVPQTLREPS